MPQAKIVTKSRRAPCSCPKRREHLLQTDPSDLILTACSAAILPQKSSFRAFFIFFRVFKKNPFRQIHPTPQRKTHTSTILSFLHKIQRKDIVTTSLGTIASFVNPFFIGVISINHFSAQQTRHTTTNRIFHTVTEYRIARQCILLCF